MEEAPAPGIAPARPSPRSASAVPQACRQIGYCGVGTFEFLYEDGAFFFIEMNTRLQVEHPVTEMTSGIDIVQQQIRVARGERLALHAGRHRLQRPCASSAASTPRTRETFAPSPGRITGWHAGAGRIRRARGQPCSAGYRVPPYYDSMIAKLIVHGQTRADALARMRQALDEMQVEGIATNLPLHRRHCCAKQASSPAAWTSTTSSAGCARRGPHEHAGRQPARAPRRCCSRRRAT